MQEKKTIVEEGTSFKGTLASSCPIDVRGKIEGEIETPSLTVSKSGAVHGRARVGSVRSEGELSGEFDADSIELAGKVLDNTIIRARSFEVKLSTQRGKMQVIFGQCELSVGDEPTEHVAVEVPVVAEAPPPPAAVVVEEPAAMSLPVSLPQPEPYMAPPEHQVLPPAMPIPEPVSLEALGVAPPPAEVMEAAASTASAGTLDEVLADLDIVAAPAEDAGKGDAKKKKKKNEEKNGETGERGWSQPPSQPPPAS
jgi:cytoskeletal protein CcmA (bactofilin family)